MEAFPLHVSRSMEGHGPDEETHIHGSSQLCSSSSSSSLLEVRLTVWCKSLLFNGNGYTVFDDSSGRMVFRVDNYACNRREETFLMDFAGNVLLTIRRSKKKLSILERWEAFRGDQDVLRLDSHQEPLIRATKTLGYPSCKIWVANDADGPPIDYLMNWSRHKGWLKIYRATCNGILPVAEVHRKSCGGAAAGSQLGKDVLTLGMLPGMDQEMIMAMIMINDAMR